MTDQGGKSREQIHDYWRSPPDKGNFAQAYVQVSPRRSEALVEVFQRHVPTHGKVLEVGCNAGRNLSFLHNAGYTNLSAIEISQAAIDTMAEAYPDVWAATDIRVGPVEKVIRRYRWRQFDAIFTMAVLVHIHPDSDWVMGRIARRAKKHLIIIEDERNISPRHFVRNYKDVFEAVGFKQIEEIAPFPGLPLSYIGRVFERRSMMDRLLKRN